MNDDFLRELQRVVDLEARRGHDDRAAIGGLSTYFQHWRRRAGAGWEQHLGASGANALAGALASYSSLAEAERPARLSEVRAILTGRETGAASRPADAGATGTRAAATSTPPATAPGSTGAAPRPASDPRHSHQAAPDRIGAPAPRVSPTRSPAGNGASAKSPRRAARPARAKGGALASGDRVTAVPGVNAATAGKLNRLGVEIVRDLLYLTPRRYLDFTRRVRIADLRPGGEVTVFATVWEARVIQFGGRQKGTEATLADETGNLRAVWFGNQYLAKSLKPGTRLAISGRPSVFKGRLTFQSPEYEVLEGDDPIHAGRLVPVHPATDGLPTRTLRRIIRAALDSSAGPPDPLPAGVRRRHDLLELNAALETIHFPDTAEDAEDARHRLAFDELLVLQLAVLARRRAWVAETLSAPIDWSPDELQRILTAFPFVLTGAQQRALDAILRDVRQSVSMSRLLQGDVGSGKTAVAAIALFLTARTGAQGALMVPTEILAEQHFRTLSRLAEQLDGDAVAGPLFGSQGIRVALLTSSLGKAKKAALYAAIAAGEIDIVVGTHAVIQEGVEFANLALAVIDEQHRFGVEQRAMLRGKGRNPHLLVMTATPIPRTLALTLYGDLDVTIIDELPPGRQTIRTRHLKPEQRGRAYEFIREQIGHGRQAFIICPLVEESETLEAKAAVQEFERLQAEVFPDLRLGLIHGRLRNDEKDAVMGAFRVGETHILVATSVIEVGIDVPNATVLLVEGADRFGLSQLHQFRGRVGRGTEESYCLLLADSPSAESRERLAILEQTSDGFRLAEEDLRLRGPGEFFGTRQSGLPDLRAARLTDTAILEMARDEATRLTDADPDLAAPEHAELAARLRDFTRWSPVGAG